MAKEIVSDVRVEDEDKIGLDDALQLSDHQEARRGIRDNWRIIAAAVFVFASLLWWSWPRSWLASYTRPTTSTSETVAVSGNEGPDIGFPDHVLRNWGQYMPWLPAGPYVLPPPNCVVNQVSFPSALFFFSPDLSVDKSARRALG
jgi:hypothetical protein